MIFPQIASRFEQRFKKGTLLATSWEEILMTQGNEESLEQWGDCVMKIAQRVLKANITSV